DRAKLRVRLESSQHLNPVHDRHRQVQQDDVRPFPLRHGESLNAIRGFVDLAGKTLEGAADDHPNRLAVVHCQDFRSHNRVAQFFWAWSPGLMRNSMKIRFPEASKLNTCPSV